jgi:hypothetical protein
MYFFNFSIKKNHSYSLNNAGFCLRIHQRRTRKINPIRIMMLIRPAIAKFIGNPIDGDAIVDMLVVVFSTGFVVIGF